MMMQTTFFWGKNFEVFFSDYPGGHSGLYALFLILVFELGILMEWLTDSGLIEAGPINVGVGLLQSFLYTIWAVLDYIMLLALLSFNGGVFLAAVAGHGVGYLIFRSRAFSLTAATTQNEGTSSN